MDPPGARHAIVSVQSRECSPELLERLNGSMLFPERSVGASIVSVVCRGSGSLLYVTPCMVDVDQQVEYFLGLLPEEEVGDQADARKRVLIGNLGDSSARWLSHKLLDPDNADATLLRAKMQDFVESGRRAGSRVELSYFEPSEPLQRLAERLGLLGDQADARHIPLGTKHAGRDLFQRVGIEVATGTVECHDTDTLAEGIADLVQGGSRRFVLKLSSTDYGAGMGNATLDLTDLSYTDRAELVVAVTKRLSGSRLVDGKLTWPDFAGLIAHAGIIAEKFIEADEIRSPSYQGRIIHGGDVITVSTHDQVLSGVGLTYVGSLFPADAAYRATVIDYGLRVGKYLVEQGVTFGDYGVDFIAARHGDAFHVVGCELNLRATGTKHGFVMATSLLDTLPDGDGRLITSDGVERVYQASDAIADPAFVGMSPAQLIEAVQRSTAHYDPSHRTGAVLHMLSALPDYGKFGAVCIASSARQAADLMQQVRDIAHATARAS